MSLNRPFFTKSFFSSHYLYFDKTVALLAKYFIIVALIPIHTKQIVRTKVLIIIEGRQRNAKFMMKSKSHTATIQSAKCEVGLKMAILDLLPLLVVLFPPYVLVYELNEFNLCAQ